MQSHHKEEYKKMMKKHEEIELLRLNQRKRKYSDGDGTRQLKLIGAGINNNLGLNKLFKQDGTMQLFNMSPKPEAALEAVRNLTYS